MNASAQAELFRDPPLSAEEQEAAHLALIRACWPEWPGPAAGLMAEVCSVMAFSISRQRKWYAYLAPVRLEDWEGGWFVGVVEYPPSAPPHCLEANGERLRLAVTDIWPPSRTLAEARWRVGGYG